ncbi:hypothetical protein AB0H76_20960 [Nocardia sp. NPDC050712]|uniref:type IV toxin-antitoxin system AbiEi family antitoxin domain-containing protein n=1 Tax=Nocardia sp. NPDC050712 TaxID=3155518 RepID=UPI0033E91855
MADELLLRKTALTHGVTDYDLRRACASGRLTRLRPGAYAHGAADPYARHRLAIKAATGVLGAGVAISHQSAAVLHGLPLTEQPDRQVHATVNRITGGRLTRNLHLHSTRFDEDEVTVVDGVLVTTPARTIADLARTTSFRDAVVTGDAALRGYGLGTEQLIDALHRWQRRRGLSQARQAILFMDGRSESPGESSSRVALHFAFLPPPRLQTEILDELGGSLGRVDFLLPEYHVIGEYGGGSPDDRQRDRALRALGGQVVRWTGRDLDDFGPVAARFRRAIARSAASRPPRWRIR